MADTPPAPTEPPPAARPGWPRFVGALNPASVSTAGVLAVVAAAVLNPIFAPPFPVLLGRTLFIASLLLLAFAAARAWQHKAPLRWLPSWLAPVVAVGAVAPLATLAVYLQTTGGDLQAFLGAKERVTGFLWIAGSGLLLGLLTALGALLRERESQARAQALAFELERARLERQAVDARLSLLQAQVEPHFLFNTLANVQALVESGSPRAGPVLQSLIDYLRAAMPRLHDGPPTLERELALVRAYLALMQMRMPDRLAFTIDVDPALGARRFPPLALLTLVENAVRHGLDPSEDGGRIDIGAAAAGGALRLWVADSGVGLHPNAAPGTGLANLRDRLQAFFGSGARLDLSEQAPRGLRAEITIPEGHA